MSWAADHLSAAEREALFNELLSRAGRRVTSRSGGNLICRCPLPGHEDKNPSFGYHPEKDLYNCATCGGGDLVRLYALIMGMTDKEAVKELAQRYNVSRDDNRAGRGRSAKAHSNKAKAEPQIIPESEWANIEQLSAEGLEFLKIKRAWDPETVKALDIRVADRNGRRLAIPIRDDQGRLLNVRLYLPGALQNKIISWGKGHGAARLFPPPAKWREGDIWLCEGEPDTICALSHGLNAVCNTTGAKTWKDEWSKLFQGRRVIIAYDADKPGQEGAKRAGQSLAKKAEETLIIKWPAWMLAKGKLPEKHGQDLTDFMMSDKGGADALESLIKEADQVVPEAPPTKDGRNPGRFWVRSADGRMSFREALLAQEIMSEVGPLTDTESGLSYLFTGTHWRPAAHEELLSLAISRLGDLATSARASGAVGQVRALSRLEYGQAMNQDLTKLCLSNGMVDLNTWRISPHQRRYRATYVHPYAFDPTAPIECPRWKRLLWESIRSLPVIRDLQEFFGYCLWPDCRYEMMLFLIGKGGTGKSTILNVMRQMVGLENCSAVSIPAMEDQFQRVALHGKALNTFSEAGSGLFESQFVKAVVSGEPAHSAYKNQQGFDMVTRAKLAFSANRFPRTPDKSDGFFRRLMVIRFPHEVPEEQRDRNLATKLQEEMMGIFQWAMVGLARLNERGGFSLSRESKAAVAEYETEINPIKSFVEERISTKAHDLGSPVEETKQAVYDAYKEWSKENGYRPMGKAQFFREFREVSPPYREQRKNPRDAPRFWLLTGIRLLPAPAPPEA